MDAQVGSRAPERARRRWTWSDIVFVLLAMSFLVGAAIHVAALVRPTIDPASPPWRHGLFVGLNLLGAAGFLKRPWYFLPAFLVLAVQQGTTHGVRAVRALTVGKFEVGDSTVVVVFLLGIAMLIRDAVQRAKNPPRPRP
jgi:hypothetical protein